MKAIVYHIFCAGNYKELVKKQMDRLVSSGVYDWCDTLEVSCVDVEGKFEGIDEIYSNLPKANVTKYENNSYEYYGIKKVWDLAQNNSGEVLYFHAKGVTNTYKNLTTKEPSQWKIDGINCWREIMEYYLIDNFQTCVEDLKDHDHCGVTCVNGWYWGNFWWANLDFIKQNPEPVHGDRWYFEAWLNYARPHKPKEYYHFTWNPYFTNLPSELYRNPSYFKDKNIEVLSAKYGTTGIQQDEGYPSDIPLVQNDVTDIIRENLQKGNGHSFSIRVDNSNFGDPVWGHRKFLIVELKIGGEPYRIVYNEGYNFILNFG